MTRSNGITRSVALALLGLPGDASPREITRAYRRLAKATHPDRTGAPAGALTLPMGHQPCQAADHPSMRRGGMASVALNHPSTYCT